MPVFGTASANSLAKCHPLLQAIANEAIKTIDFKVLDASRGRVAQEMAFNSGNSQVHFGDSAHNWSPAIAFDLFPAPYDWNNSKAFKALSRVILAMPKQLGLKGLDGKRLVLRWGGDFRMDGDRTTDDGWDGGHFELHPWRDWAKNSEPYEG